MGWCVLITVYPHVQEICTLPERDRYLTEPQSPFVTCYVTKEVLAPIVPIQCPQDNGPLKFRHIKP